MSVIYLGLPLWYWILMGIGVVFILITEILGEFRCYDLWVDGEFYRGCTYRHHPRNALFLMDIGLGKSLLKNFMKS